MKIGNIDLGEMPVLLGPMEDVTDGSFRGLCREQGAALIRAGKIQRADLNHLTSAGNTIHHEITDLILLHKTPVIYLPKPFSSLRALPVLQTAMKVCCANSGLTSLALPCCTHSAAYASC